MREKLHSHLKYCLLTVFYILLFSLTIQAYGSDIEVVVDDINYIIHEETETASVGNNQYVEKENLVIADYITYEGKRYNVTEISNEAFISNRWLTGSLTIGNYVTIIGESAFAFCSNLEGPLIMGNSIQEIKNEAFYRCSNIKGSLIFPNSLKTIGRNAFKECKGFTGSLDLSNVLELDQGAFRDCWGLDGKLTLNENLKYIPVEAFYKCSFTGQLILPTNLEEIGATAFWNCYKLAGNLILPPLTKKIGNLAFEHCDGLGGKLVLNNDLTYIGSSAFSDCNFKEELRIPEKIEKIQVAAFSHNKFSSLFLPESITEIETSAFKNNSLTQITCLASNPPICGNAVFRVDDNYGGDKADYTIPLYVPAESIEQYRNAPTWRNFLNVRPIEGEIEIESISLNETEINIESTETFQLIATVLPDNATNKTLKWISLESNIATVDENGLVTARTPGLTTITATTSNGLSATCKVTVNPVNAVSVTLNVSEMTLLIGQSDKLIATVYPENVTDNTITCTSDNEEIATVSPDGTVTAGTVGVANIKASCGDVSATCKVTVNPVTASTVTLNVSDMTLLVGQSDKLTATVYPENTTDKTTTWTSDNESVAAVSSDGTVTAVTVGVANITATCGDVSAICKVTVNPVTASTITLNVSEMTLFIGQSDKLTATVSPGNVTDKTITWTSDNKQIVTVSEDGTVTAAAIGVANITASCGDVSATCKVMVNPVTASTVTLNVSEMTLFIGQTDKLTATVSPKNVTDKTIIWTSDNESVATVSPDGTVTAVSAGLANISASCGEVSATCKVTVIEIDRPETPKEFIKKGDGKSCTFVVMMNLSDSELAKEGYNFVYGYTDNQDTDHIIASSPLRYCHTTSEIFNDIINDFWVYSYRYDANGDIVMSGRRHLDGNVDYDNDPVLLNEYLTRSFTTSDPDNWITPTSRGARIQIASSNSSLLTIHTLSGTLVYSDTFNSGKTVDMEISGDRFVADIYVVTIQSGEIRTSKKIVIR